MRIAFIPNMAAAGYFPCNKLIFKKCKFALIFKLSAPGFEHCRVNFSKADNILDFVPVLLLAYGERHALFGSSDERCIPKTTENLDHRDEQ